MKTVEVRNEQTILDIALQHYGTAEAVGKILSDNPGLDNDPSAVVEAGRELGAFYPDIKLKAGTQISIDDDSRLIKKTVIKKIERNITTYMTIKWQEQLRK